MIKRYIYILVIYLLIELCLFSIDLFYFSYCKPTKLCLDTFIIRIVSKQSTVCTISNKLRNNLEISMLDYLHLLSS
jgi:hypothetical protein